MRTNSFQSHPANYKPSPLSFGSPRASPFRRPESPSSPSTTIRPTTPTHTSTKPTTPSKLREASAPPSSDTAWTPRGQNLLSVTPREAPTSPTRYGGGAGDSGTASPSSGAVAAALVATGQKEGNLLPYTRENGNERVLKDVNLPAPRKGNNDALSRLPPAQVREMREAYQILDRDNDGQVSREDVADILGSLGTSNTLEAGLWSSFGHPIEFELMDYIFRLRELLGSFGSLLPALTYPNHGSSYLPIHPL